MTNDLSLLVRNANPVPTVDHLSEDEFNAALAAIETSLEEKPMRKRFTPFFQRMRQRPVIVFAAAMVIVVLAVAVPVFLVSTPKGEVTEPTTVTTTLAPTTTAPPTTSVPPTSAVPPTTAATTTTSAAPAPPAPAISWTRVPDQPGLEGAAFGALSPLVKGGPGLVAVGFYYGEVPGAVLLSEDGVTWENVALPWDEMGSWSEVLTVASGPGGTLVAAGSDGSDAAVFVSSDGYTWSRALSDALGGPDLQNILKVIAGGPGFIAVGDDGSDAAVWVSPDGYGWSKIEDDDLLAGDDINASIYDVAAGGPGFVAVGNAGLFDGAGIKGAVWVSPDGYQWERLRSEMFDAESGDTGFQSMTVHPSTGRIIAWGSEMWASQDGYHWTVTERGPSLDGPPPGSETVWNGNEGVAVGFDMAHSMWVTGDGGSNWTRVDPVGPAFDPFADQAVAVAWFNDQWIVAGTGDYGGVVWIGTSGE